MSVHHSRRPAAVLNARALSCRLRLLEHPMGDEEPFFVSRSSIEHE